jgi:hypothetical protein
MFTQKLKDLQWFKIITIVFVAILSYWLFAEWYLYYGLMGQYPMYPDRCAGESGIGCSLNAFGDLVIIIILLPIFIRIFVKKYRGLSILMAYLLFIIYTLVFWFDSGIFIKPPLKIISDIDFPLILYFSILIYRFSTKKITARFNKIIIFIIALIINFFAFKLILLTPVNLEYFSNAQYCRVDSDCRSSDGRLKGGAINKYYCSIWGCDNQKEVSCYLGGSKYYSVSSINRCKRK